jgi:hypothetical protein
MTFRQWIAGRRSIEVPCTVEIEHTAESLHAFVDLDGIEVGPGDAVQVHDAPVDVAFGEKLVCRRQATVVQAGWLERQFTRLVASMELTELYEVSFTRRRTL